VTRLLVVDVDQLLEGTPADRECALHLLLDRTRVFDGPLSSEVLAQLTHIARTREQQDADNLAALLGAPTIGAFKKSPTEARP
jgi:hypothetical protein